MFSDPTDPLLDAFLDEVLNGRTPPDLSPRILEALTARRSLAEQEQARGGTVSQASAPAYLADATTPQPPPVLTKVGQSLSAEDVEAVVQLRATTNRRDRRRSEEISGKMIAVAGCVVALGLLVGVTALFTSGRKSVVANKVVHTESSDSGAQRLASPDVPREAEIRASGAGTSSSTVELAGVKRQPEPLPDGANESGSVSSPTIASAPSRGSAPAYVAPLVLKKSNLQPSPDGEVLAFVNAELARGWQEAGVRPAPPASDAEWCQRAYMRILGRNPNVAERQAFLDDKATDRREKLVEHLLSEPNNSRRYARQWSLVWTDALLGHAGGREGSLASREELEKYLRSAFAESKPFNRIAAELLTATGSAKPGAKDYNPAVNFLLDGFDANAIVPTSRVARVLLGHQLNCAQCHDSPAGGFSQEQFWALNSFFRQMRIDQHGESPRLVNTDFAGQDGNRDGAVVYGTSAGATKTAFPHFLDGTEVATSGKLAEVDRRRELALLVAQSDDLPKAVVNRVWTQFFDYGLVSSLDDLSASGSTPRAKVIGRLAQEFAARDYDLKAIIRWTALSDSFGRSSKLTDLASKDMPEEGELPLFSRYYARPVQTAQVFDSLVQAARIRRTAANDSERQQARVDWLAQFNRAAGKAGGKTPGGGGPSLMIQGGPSIQRTGSRESNGMVTKIATSSLSFDKKVEHLFLAAAARQPTPREQRAAADLLRMAKDDQISALGDIWWALLNSAECVVDR